MDFGKKKLFIINFLYFSIWVIVIYLTFRVALAYLLPFFIGITIAYLVQKPSVIISNKIKIKRENCAAFLAAIFFILVVATLALIFWLLYTQLSDFFIYLGEKTPFFNIRYNKIMENFKNDALMNVFNSLLDGVIKSIGTFASEIITDLIKKIPIFFISCVITVVATCYISKDYERLKKFFYNIFGQKHFLCVVEIKNILVDCVFKILVAYFWIFIITFVQLLIGFIILGIDKYFIIAVIVALFDLLPVIGTGTVLLPWSAFLFVQNEFTIAIGLVVIYLVTIITRNFIEPKIIGKQIQINPLFMLVFIFIGLKIGGVVGMIVLPLVFTVFFTYFRNKFVIKNY